jgi:hypothetical protein
MNHFIYSIHACSGSRWSKGYTEFYFTDRKNPTGDNPVMSVIVLQLGETEELVLGGSSLDASVPSITVMVRIVRATYDEKPYGMKEQKGYLFPLSKYDIGVLIGMCQDKIDTFLEGKEVFDVNDSRFVNWGYQVPP